MTKSFSKNWKSSKRPGKQKKYVAQAPLHIKRKFLSVNLSKELRKKHGKKNMVLRKDDIVKIMRGKFKGKTGKVLLVSIKNQRIEIEGIQMNKQDKSKSNVPIKSSNIQITELYLEDRKRLKQKSNKEKEEKKQETVKLEKLKKSQNKKQVSKPKVKQNAS